MKLIQYIGLFAALLIMGCRETVSIEPKPRMSMSLPTELSQSLDIAFRDNPAFTAERFLQTFDRFENYSPVTRTAVENHARLHATLDRGQRLGGILAVDLNEDGLITRIEFETVSALPNGHDKSVRMAGLFEFDKNKDDLMTFEEAIRFGESLNARANAQTLRPIESYLMLFDRNNDGRVQRDEMVEVMNTYLAQSGRYETASHVGLRSP